MIAKYPGYPDYVRAIAQGNLAYGVITALAVSCLGWVIFARSWGTRWIIIGRIAGVALFYGFVIFLCATT
jgi:hypothetical protein